MNLFNSSLISIHIIDILSIFKPPPAKPEKVPNIVRINKKNKSTRY